MHTTKQHITAALVLFCCVAEGLLATPGVDQLGANRLTTEKSRHRMKQEPLGFVAVGAADANRAVRLPLVNLLSPLQRPLRIAQSWGLYGGGPSGVERMEILIDNTLVYRSKDPAHEWLAPVLTYRRVRPIVNTTCQSDSRNDAHLMAFILTHARADFPDAKEVVVRCTTAEFTAPTDTTELVRYTATGPEWVLSK